MADGRTGALARVMETMDIRAPIEQVFAAVTDPRRSAEWNPNIVDVSPPSPLPIQIGSTWLQTTMIMGKPVTLQCRVTDLQAPVLGRLEVTGPQRATIVTTCQPVPGATRVTQTVEFAPPGGIFGALAAGFAGPMLQREVRRTMEGARTSLEAEWRDRGGPGTG